MGSVCVLNDQCLSGNVKFHPRLELGLEDKALLSQRELCCTADGVRDGWLVMVEETVGLIGRIWFQRY